MAALNAGLAAARGALVAPIWTPAAAPPPPWPARQRIFMTKITLTFLPTCVAFGGDRELAHGFALWIGKTTCSRTNRSAVRIFSRYAGYSHLCVFSVGGVWEKWGAYRDGDFAEDWEIWLRWLHQGAVMEKLPEQMLVWNVATYTRHAHRPLRYAREPEAGTGCVAGFAGFEQNNPFHPQVWVVGGRAHAYANGLHPCGGMALFLPRALILTRKIGNRIRGVAVMRPLTSPAGQCCS